MDIFEENMTKLENLSKKYEFSEQAKWIREILDLYRKDKHLFFSNFENNDFWGKLFCIGDNTFYSINDISKNESLVDNDIHIKCIIRIYEVLEKNGYQNLKIKSMTDAFKRWVDDEVYKKFME
jgi:hypothetical protein